MKVKPFKCIIESVFYVSAQRKKSNGETIPTYICNVTIKESGKGSAFEKNYHNLILYMNQEQFDNRVLEKGDEIQVNDAKWKPITTYYTSYSKKTIDKADKSKLKVSPDGRVYFIERVFSYKISVKNENWELIYKWYNLTYMKIANNAIKLPLISKQQFDLDIIDFVLEEKEFTGLKELDSTEQLVTCYHKNNKFADDTRKISVFMDPNEEFILRIEKIKEETSNE